MSSYRYALENDRFVICDGDKVLKTPAGNPVTTLYQPLAERLVQDLKEYGPSSFSAGSALPWHYTMIDNFASMSHEAVERELIGSFLSQPDWTFFENQTGEFNVYIFEEDLQSGYYYICLMVNNMEFWKGIDIENNILYAIDGEFSPEDSNWQVNTIQGAIDYLYQLYSN